MARRTIARPRCRRKHNWSTDVRYDTLYCLDCPASITVARKCQLDRARRQAQTVAAIRQRQRGTHVYIANNDGIDCCEVCGKRERSVEHTGVSR